MQLQSVSIRLCSTSDDSRHSLKLNSVTPLVCCTEIEYSVSLAPVQTLKSQDIPTGTNTIDVKLFARPPRDDFALENAPSGCARKPRWYTMADAGPPESVIRYHEVPMNSDDVLRPKGIVK